MATLTDRHDERKVTRKLAAERKAKHDAPYAARVLSDPATFGPRNPRFEHTSAQYTRDGGSWS